MQGKIITGIGLCIAKEGGMAVSAVWRPVYLLVAYPWKRKITLVHIDGTPVPSPNAR
jgi:hypothetical protein